MTYLGLQLDYLLLLQNFRELSCHILDKFFLFITMFGESTLALIFICAMYWCINKKAGTFLILNYMCGFIMNLFLKCTFCIYRPWILDSRIIPVKEAVPAATGYSFPSGHTAGALSVWGGTGFFFRKNKFIVFTCILIILLVMFSRNYLGVHTLQDVIVSCIVGIALIWGLYKLLNWEQKAKNRDLIILAAVSVISILILIYVNVKSYPLDYVSGELLFNPSSVKIKSFARIGWIISMFAGWIIEKRFINFNPQKGNIINKIVRLLLGMVFVFGLLSIHSSSKFILFILYFFHGLFITAIYPLLIKKCKFI